MMGRTKQFVNHVVSQIDALAGKLLITVFLGKFGGDLAAHYLSQQYPRPTWMWIGFGAAIILMVVWVPFERAYLKT